MAWFLFQVSDKYKPWRNAWTPFFRRFTDERARELAETKRLYEDLRVHHRASQWADKEAIFKISTSVLQWAAQHVEIDTGALLFGPLLECQLDVLEAERAVFGFPENVEWDRLDLADLVELRTFLRAKDRFLSHEHHVIDELTIKLGSAFSGLWADLPTLGAASGFTVPLIDLLDKPDEIIDKLIGTFINDDGLFAELNRCLYENICYASNLIPHAEHKKPLVMAADSELRSRELVETYLRGTPYLGFFLTSVPFSFTSSRTSHMHVVGGSGSGKTQLLQNLILSDLKAPDPPAMVIVDSQGDLIDKLSHLALFESDRGPLARKLVIISPRDIAHPPAINIFDVNQKRFDKYDPATREQVVAGVIQTFDYLFSGLIGADLTAKQSVIFRYLARLMLALPPTLGRNATILDLLQLMDDATPYLAAMKSLPPIQRQFFEKDFSNKSFNATKEQIRYRLNAILENPTLARLFTAPVNRLDLFDELNSGAIILVDTAKDFLKGGSSHFGRIFISLVLQAVLERAAIPERKRRTAYLIVDEAAEYFDSNIDDLLTQARKYNMGCLFSHQFLDQATPALRASLAANTSIKLAGAVSTNDARALAPELRTTTDFVLSQGKLHFACYVRNMTKTAVSLGVPFGTLEREPQLSPDAYQSLQAINRGRVSIPPSPPPATSERSPTPELSSDPDVTDTSASEWGTPKH
jgi:hypothetical protein